EYICLQAGTERHCASRPGAILTEAGYQGVATQEVLAEILRLLDGTFDPDFTQSFFQTRGTGGDNVGSFERQELSTTGEERDIVIFEDLPEEDQFDDRGFGDAAKASERFPESPQEPYQGL
ncbi:MAG: hypothetical protein AAF439_16140, partial [Pseudomonadota bacterium]